MCSGDRKGRRLVRQIRDENAVVRRERDQLAGGPEADLGKGPLHQRTRLGARLRIEEPQLLRAGEQHLALGREPQPHRCQRHAARHLFGRPELHELLAGRSGPGADALVPVRDVDTLTIVGEQGCAHPVVALDELVPQGGRRRVEQARPTIVCRRDDHLSVRGEPDLPHGLLVPTEASKLLRRVEEEQAGRHVRTGRRHPAPIGRDVQGVDRSAVTFETPQLPAGSHIPHDRDTLRSGRHRHAAVGGEHDVVHRSDVAELDREGRHRPGDRLADHRRVPRRSGLALRIPASCKRQDEQADDDAAHRPRPGNLELSHSLILA